jgi:hypothetical protein
MVRLDIPFARDNKSKKDSSTAGIDTIFLPRYEPSCSFVSMNENKHNRNCRLSLQVMKQMEKNRYFCLFGFAAVS